MEKNKNNKQKEREDMEWILRESLRKRFRDDFERELKERASKKSVRSPISMINWRTILPYAAAALFVLAIATWFLNPFGTNLEKKAFALLESTDGYRLDNRDRGAKSEVLTLEDDLPDDVYYERVVDLFASRELTSMNDDEKMIFAYSIMRTQKASLSVADSVLASISNASSGIESEKLWLQGLCQLLLGNKVKAKQILEELQVTSSYKQKEVKQLLIKLNNSKQS